MSTVKFFLLFSTFFYHFFCTFLLYNERRRLPVVYLDILHPTPCSFFLYSKGGFSFYFWHCSFLYSVLETVFAKCFRGWMLPGLCQLVEWHSTGHTCPFSLSILQGTTTWSLEDKKGRPHSEVKWFFEFEEEIRIKKGYFCFGNNFKYIFIFHKAWMY